MNQLVFISGVVCGHYEQIYKNATFQLQIRLKVSIYKSTYNVQSV